MHHLACFFTTIQESIQQQDQRKIIQLLKEGSRGRKKFMPLKSQSQDTHQSLCLTIISSHKRLGTSLNLYYVPHGHRDEEKQNIHGEKRLNPQDINRYEYSLNTDLPGTEVCHNVIHQIFISRAIHF